ncbi:gonadal somatic cell derived factor isoform X1 [Silurus meridionalis]|nr:gonadal somatic cell derived factor isoform X1 [Silurus meridionalis]
MVYLSSFWLQWGMVCSVFASMFAQDSSWDCTDTDDILRDVPADVNMPSQCTLDCTARTYRAILKLHNRLTIRFKDSHAGDTDEFCWSSKIQCSPGQRLQSAFILLPVDSSGANRETLILEMNGATLHQHLDVSLLPPECGLRFEVTDRLAAKEPLCVKIPAQEQGTLGSGLVCPPFLVTTWEKCNQG